MGIDQADREVLRALQGVLKPNFALLSRKTGIPRTTLISRVGRLEERGIIKGYYAKLNPSKLGFSVKAFVLVKASRAAPPEPPSLQERLVLKILSETRGSKELWVEEAHIITGEYDIILKVWSRSLDALADFLVRRLPRYPGIVGTHTMIVLSSEEQDYVPL